MMRRYKVRVNRPGYYAPGQPEVACADCLPLWRCARCAAANEAEYARRLKMSVAEVRRIESAVL